MWIKEMLFRTVNYSRIPGLVALNAVRFHSTALVCTLLKRNNLTTLSQLNICMYQLPSRLKKLFESSLRERTERRLDFIETEEECNTIQKTSAVSV